VNLNAPSSPEVPKWILTVLNHLYEVESKLRRQGDSSNALRNVDKMKEAIASEGVFFEDPFGQDFKETRTDLEATITGQGTESLRVVEVIKPIIRIGTQQLSRVVQKGIVVVQSTS
jgi:hypothetical protein